MSAPREKKLRCLFYPKVVCPVRNEMQKTQVLEGKLMPLKGRDEEMMISKMVKSVTQVLSMQYAALAGFCHICPKKNAQDFVYRQKMTKKWIKQGLIKEMQSLTHHSKETRGLSSI